MRDVFGSYCAVCEQHLPYDARPWDAVTGKPLAGTAVQSRWPNVFALCPYCAEAGTLASGLTSMAPDGLLLPDRNATFALGAVSPLRYERQSVPQRFLDAETAAVASSSSRDAVLVVGENDQARATIRHFALNSPFFDEATNTLSVPDGVDLDSVDPRLDLRLDAWDTATRYAGLLKTADDPVWHRTLLEQARMTLFYSGFWSVWATVLWSTLQDFDLVTNLLMPGASAPLAAGRTPEPSPQGRFRNTRAGWLPPPTSQGAGASNA